jgi:hypothetical protein
MPTRRPYPSDLSDARWELIEPVLAAWRFERRGRALGLGRPPEHALRDSRRGPQLSGGPPVRRAREKTAAQAARIPCRHVI